MHVFFNHICQLFVKTQNVIIIQYCLRMAYSMESKTIETFLRSLGLDNLTITFQENDVGFDLLMDLTDAELKELLIEIQVSPGNRLRITKGIERFKAGGMYTRHRDILRHCLIRIQLFSSHFVFIAAFLITSDHLN